MKYMKQFGNILCVTCIGEALKYFIHLPIPSSIYGLVLMLLFLKSGVVKVENVKATAEFLIEIMPLMFIPAAVGLIDSWGRLRSILALAIIITVVSTFAVMIVTGKVTDFFIESRKRKSHE